MDSEYENGSVLPLPFRGTLGYIIKPNSPVDPQRRWVWIAPLWVAMRATPSGKTFAHYYADSLLKAGFHVVGLDVGASCGSPAGVELYQKFYEMLVDTYQLHPEARLLGVSNGGLISYAWAFRYPNEVDPYLWCLSGHGYAVLAGSIQGGRSSARAAAPRSGTGPHYTGRSCLPAHPRRTRSAPGGVQSHRQPGAAGSGPRSRSSISTATRTSSCLWNRTRGRPCGDTRPWAARRSSKLSRGSDTAGRYSLSLNAGSSFSPSNERSALLGASVCGAYVGSALLARGRSTVFQASAEMATGAVVLGAKPGDRILPRNSIVM